MGKIVEPPVTAYAHQEASETSAEVLQCCLGESEEGFPDMDTAVGRLRLDFGRWYDIVADGGFFLARHIVTGETIRTVGEDVMRSQLSVHHRDLRTSAETVC
jgi:hypothetical protein